MLEFCVQIVPIMMRSTYTYRKHLLTFFRFLFPSNVPASVSSTSLEYPEHLYACNTFAKSSWYRFLTGARVLALMIPAFKGASTSVNRGSASLPMKRQFLHPLFLTSFYCLWIKMLLISATNKNLLTP